MNKKKEGHKNMKDKEIKVKYCGTKNVTFKEILDKAIRNHVST